MPKNKKTIKTTLWDRIQHVFRKYYDGMAHMVFNFNQELNSDVLSNVLVGIIEKNPILHSHYKSLFFKSYWFKNDKYQIKDFFQVIQTNNLESDVNKFITSQIPLKSVQIQVRLFNCNNKSTLAILINHMCMDGVDVKYICYQICYNYNNFLKGNKVIDIKIGKRDHNEIYADFNKQDQKAAKRLYKNITLTKSKVKFPWSKKSKEDKSNIVVHKLNKHQYDKLKYIAKQYHTTLNTTLLAVFFHSLYEICNVEPNNPIIVQCAIDLRRHLKDKGINLGLTNHTGFFPCELSHRCDTIKQTLVETIKTIELIKNDKFIGLHGIALLNLGYHLFPNRIMKWLIRIGYRNPLIGMSNIGIIDDNKLQFGTTKLVDGYITGAIKYKPYMQLALTTLNDVITMTIAIKGNDQDKKEIEKFYELIDKNIEKL